MRVFFLVFSLIVFNHSQIAIGDESLVTDAFDALDFSVREKYCDNLYDMKDEVRTYRWMLRGFDIKKSNHDAEMQYQEAPGDANKAYNNAINLSLIEEENYFKELLGEKLVEGLKFDLYIESNKRGEPGVDFYDTHEKSYCSYTNDIERDLFASCVGALAGKQFSFGDLKISNLLSFDFIGDLNHQNLVDDMILNLVYPFPTNDANDILQKYSAALKTNRDKVLDPKEQAQLANFYVGASITSLVRYSFLKMYNDRLPFVVEEKDDITNSSTKVPTDFSKAKIMKDEVSRRFSDKEWYINVATSSKESLLREMVHMLAYEIWEMMQEYESQERIETLLAVQVSAAARSEQAIDKMSNAGSNSGS